MQAERSNGQWVLSGSSSLVLGAISADGLLVSARSEQGLVIAWVDASNPHLEVRAQNLMDHRNCAQVELNQVLIDDALIDGRIMHGCCMHAAGRPRGAGRGTGRGPPWFRLGSAMIASRTCRVLLTYELVLTKSHLPINLPIN